jgi:hypothetical protein
VKNNPENFLALWLLLAWVGLALPLALAVAAAIRWAAEEPRERAGKEG